MPVSHVACFFSLEFYFQSGLYLSLPNEEGLILRICAPHCNESSIACCVYFISFKNKSMNFVRVLMKVIQMSCRLVK